MSNKSDLIKEAKTSLGIIGLFTFALFILGFFFMNPSNAQEVATKAPELHKAEQIREAHREARAKMNKNSPSSETVAYCGAYVPPGVDLSREEVSKLGEVHGCSEVTVFFYGHR